MDHVRTEKVEKPLDSGGTNVIRDVDEFLNTPVRNTLSSHRHLEIKSNEHIKKVLFALSNSWWVKVHYDPFKRNKIPFALRIRGSILVGMVPTLVLVAVWSSIVVYVHMYHHDLAVDSVLITITGEL